MRNIHGSMKGIITKYNVIIWYTIFFLASQILLVGFAVEVLTTQFETLSIPSCSLGLFILDGLLTCAFDFITLFFNLFTLSSDFLILEVLFIIPFLIALSLIVADLLRGSG